MSIRCMSTKAKCKMCPTIDENAGKMVHFNVLCKLLHTQYTNEIYQKGFAKSN